MNLNRYIALAKAAVFLMLLPARSSCQELLVQEKNIGFNVGANLAFGSHFRRLGFNLNFFYVDRAFQANTELRAYISFKNLGPKSIYPELVLAQGLLYGYGDTHAYFNPFLNSVSNQTRYANAVAYSYNLYFNKRRTTQQTGIIALQFDYISVIIENDILARTYYDRFRTGAFLLQYQYLDQYQAALNCTLWTGKMGRTVSAEPGSRWPCYMDTTGGVYATYSHGLLSGQFKYNVRYSQNVQANIGVDAEQVRDAVQNKFIHDLLLPKNCHMPMIDQDGNQYLYEPGQVIRKPRLYWNLFSNANLFY